MGVTERPKSLNPSKAIAMAICPIIVHFSTWRARSMHDVACKFARAAVRSKDAQKQLARTSLRQDSNVNSNDIIMVLIMNGRDQGLRNQSAIGYNLGNRRGSSVRQMFIGRKDMVTSSTDVCN